MVHKHKWPDLSPPVPYHKPSFPAQAARCLRKGCEELAPVLETPDLRPVQTEHTHTWTQAVYQNVKENVWAWVQVCTGCSALQVL